MKQHEFVEKYEPTWKAFAALVDAMSKAQPSRAPKASVAEFPFMFRQLSQQLALARDRNYSAHLIERLNQLVLKGHQHLYRARRGTRTRVARFFASEFPARVRADAGLVWVACALLYLPAAAMVLAVALNPDFVYSVLAAEQLERYEQMYDPQSSHFARERDSDSDFAMFGFYIKNNISVGFQTFAGGILLGLGSMFYLVYNGLLLGIVGAHLHNVGFGETFYAFVITHGAFELTAIALAGAAGLKLGFALLAPGRRLRSVALREAARECVTIIYGVIGLLVVAAFVEAFWSSSTLVPAAAKFAVGTACWLLVAIYLLRVGRADGS